MHFISGIKPRFKSAVFQLLIMVKKVFQSEDNGEKGVEFRWKCRYHEKELLKSKENAKKVLNVHQYSINYEAI